MAMETFLTHAGYPALILFGFVQACCIPISSEITFGFAGVLAAQHGPGHLNLALVIIIGTAAEFAGSFLAYLVGRWGGRPAVDRLGRYVLLTQRDVDRAERFFAGRGAWVVALGRVIPLLRAFVGLVAGLIEVPVGPFAIFDLIGTAIWAAALSSIGYAVGSEFTKINHYLSLGSYVLLAVVVVSMAVLILLRLREFRKERRAADALAAADAPATPAAPAAPAGPAGPGSHRRTRGPEPR
jgi:membrane protein DedA with SNARE-associated domain